jgi:hypothetical protein
MPTEPHGTQWNVSHTCFVLVEVYFGTECTTLEFCDQSGNYMCTEIHTSHIGMQIDMLQYIMEHTLHNKCKVTGHSLRVISWQRKFSKISALTHNM